MGSNFWDKNATAWTDTIRSGKLQSRSITNQAILDSLLETKPRSVLDIGCGEGWLGSRLQGLTQYTGLDGSQALIEKAKTSYGEHFQQVSYQEIIDQAWQPTESFDAVVFNFALMDENLVPLLSAVAKFLNPQGHLFIQTLHPFFGQGDYKNGWNVEDFKSFPLPIEGTMPWFGRTLSSWTETFEKSGLVLQSIREPSNGALPVSIIFNLARK